MRHARVTIESTIIYRKVRTIVRQMQAALTLIYSGPGLGAPAQQAEKGTEQEQELEMGKRKRSCSGSAPRAAMQRVLHPSKEAHVPTPRTGGACRRSDPPSMKGGERVPALPAAEAGRAELHPGLEV